MDADEMALAGGRGATVALADEHRPDAVLFGEAHSRVVIAVEPRRLDEARDRLERAGVPHSVLGSVGGDTLSLTLAAHNRAFGAAVAALREAFERPLREVLG